METFCTIRINKKFLRSAVKDKLWEGALDSCPNEGAINVVREFVGLDSHQRTHIRICRLIGLDSDQIEFNMQSMFKAMRKIRKHEAMQVVEI